MLSLNFPGGKVANPYRGLDLNTTALKWVHK